MSGIWTIVPRFACHLPMGLVAFSGKRIYDAVGGLADTGIYDAIPHGQTFLSGLKMYTNWGLFAFVWNFVMFLGCLACQSHLAILLGAIDFMVAMSLLASVVKQAKFLPRTYAACGGASDWRNGTDGWNLFVEAEWDEHVRKTYKLPAEGICRLMVETWAITISMVIIYGLMGLINILFGLLFAYHDPAYNNQRGPYRGRWDYSWYYRQARGDCVLLWRTLPGFPRWIFSAFLRIVDQPLAAIRFAFRYTCKALSARKSPKARMPSEPKVEEALAKKCFSEKGVKPPVLPYEVLLLVCQDLHFVDLVNASCASSTLRTSLFGSVGLELSNLRAKTCNLLGRLNCQLCGIQTCVESPTYAHTTNNSSPSPTARQSCANSIPLALSPAATHSNQCKPYCSKCFYSTACRGWARRGDWSAGHERNCPLAVPRKDIEMGTALGLLTEMRTLCHTCVKVAPAERRKRFKARDAVRQEMELDRQWRETTDCGKCGQKLGATGPRWWVCKGCSAECGSHVHPVWSEKKQ